MKSSPMSQKFNPLIGNNKFVYKFSGIKFGKTKIKHLVALKALSNCRGEISS